MQENFELICEVRTAEGKGASRRLRREGKVPAILYGGSEAALPLTMSHNELMKHLAHEAFYSHILTVKHDGKTEKAVLRAVQRHPAKPVVLHIDLLRVSESEKLRMNVPLHFLNGETCNGVKQQGGIVSHLMTEVEVSCLAKDLPEFIAVDLAELSVGDAIHLSQLNIPAGVEVVELMHGPEHDQAVVSIHLPRGAIETAADEEAEGGEGEEGAAS